MASPSISDERKGSMRIMRRGPWAALQGSTFSSATRDASQVRDGTTCWNGPKCGVESAG